jgi:hypothetical protein
MADLENVEAMIAKVFGNCEIGLDGRHNNIIDDKRYCYYVEHEHFTKPLGVSIPIYANEKGFTDSMAADEAIKQFIAAILKQQ